MTPMANPFAVAQAQFDQASGFLGLDPALASLLRQPMREIVFQLPLKMDDGSTRVLPAFRIQYNHARGPCKGGVRWHADESLDTGRALAAWMTWKAAVMDIPLGGASGGVLVDSKKLSNTEKERLARAWIRAMSPFMGEHVDVPGPDVYTTPQILAWMLDEYETIKGGAFSSAVTGKPQSLGGTLGRADAVARGGIMAVREACREMNLAASATTYVVQGFGTVGRNVALLHPQILGGGKLLAASDTSGGVYHSTGLDVNALVEYKMKTGQLAGFPGGKAISNEDLLELETDVLYPAALENVITKDNAERIHARILCELANGPTTPEADTILHVNGVHLIPDFLANAGGLTVSYFEQVQGASNYYWSLEEVCKQLDYKMAAAYHQVLRMQKDHKVHIRLAAYLVAINRVAEAVRARGWV